MKRRHAILLLVLLPLALLLHLLPGSGGRGPLPAPPVETATPGAPAPAAIGERGGVVPSDDPEGREQAEAEPVPEPTAPERPAGAFLDLHGRVVDLVTGEAIEGARVLYVVGGCSYGDDTGSDGRFAYERTEAEIAGSAGFELQAFAVGYEPWKRVPDASEVLVEMNPLGRPSTPGTIRGRAVDSGYRPLSGVLDLDCVDANDRHRYFTVLADEEGRFEIPGLAPGAWRVRLYFDGHRQGVWIPAGGAGEIELAAGVATRAPEIEPLTAETVRGHVSRLEAEEYQLYESERRGGRPADSGKVWGLQKERRRLQTDHRDLLGAREVVVTGLPAGEGAVLRADHSPEHWQVAVEGGRARFPTLFPGTCRLTRFAPGEAPVIRQVRVEEGRGPQRIAFSGD